MGFKIPNAPDASVIDQSEPDSGDFKALGDRKTGVISGCVVSANTVNDQNVLVTDGEVVSNGVYRTLTGSGGSTQLSLGLGTAGSARFDAVVINSSGTLVARTGTAGSNPTFPTLSDGDVFLAAVYRASGTTDVISATRIIDKSILTASNTARSGSGAPSGTLGSVGDLYVNTAVSSNNGQSQLYVKTTSSSWENIAEYYPLATANTANTIVQRGSSGEFSAGAITATSLVGPLTGNVTGAVTGNASTATAFNSGRAVTLTGDVAGTATGVTDGNYSLSTTIGTAKIKTSMIDYTSVAQMWVSTLAPTTEGKNGDIWIQV